MKNKEDNFGLYGEVNWGWFNCPICDDFDDIFIGTESSSKREHTCSCCKAHFKLEEPRFKSVFGVWMKPIFQYYECDNCGKNIGVTKPQNKLCEDCQIEERERRIKRLKELEEELKKFL